MKLTAPVAVTAFAVVAAGFVAPAAASASSLSSSSLSSSSLSSSTSPVSEGLRWMDTQRVQVGENGPTVTITRQVGDACSTVERTSESTVVECSDIEMALVGSMIELHLNSTVIADVTETKVGSVNHALDYTTRTANSFNDGSGTLQPGERTVFTTPRPGSRGRPDWFLGLDGKLGNSGTARIVLSTR
ncbi:hypothetical protein LQL77_30750 [Rhodococcus cerastii]|nr:hypothetical protein [Rhodococcus cerastii]